MIIAQNRGESCFLWAISRTICYYIIKWRQRNMGSISSINPGMPFIAPWDIFEQIGGVLAEVYGALSPFSQLETMQSNGWKRIRETIHGVSLLFQGNFISGDHQPMGPLFVSPALHTKPKHYNAIIHANMLKQHFSPNPRLNDPELCTHESISRVYKYLKLYHVQQFIFCTY